MIINKHNARKDIFLYQYCQLSIDKRIAFKSYLYAIARLNGIPVPITMNRILGNTRYLLYMTHTRFTMESMADCYIHSITKRSTKQSYGTH